jgi:hypothetical protein
VFAALVYLVFVSIIVIAARWLERRVVLPGIELSGPVVLGRRSEI